VRSSTRFDTDQARCKFGKKAGDLCPLQLSPDDYPTCHIDPMHLKDAFEDLSW
jgi:hypothetical protein